MPTKLGHTPEQHAEAAKIGRRLAWARQAQGITRADLATRAGIDASFVKSMENGLRVPSVLPGYVAMPHPRNFPAISTVGNVRGVASELSAKLAVAHPELLKTRHFRMQTRQIPAKRASLDRAQCPPLHRVCQTI